MKKANSERAERIDRVMAAFVTIMSEYEDSPYGDEPDDDKLADLLADIRHWADKHKVNIYRALTRSYNYYLEEKK